MSPSFLLSPASLSNIPMSLWVRSPFSDSNVAMPAAVGSSSARLSFARATRGSHESLRPPVEGAAIRRAHGQVSLPSSRRGATGGAHPRCAPALAEPRRVHHRVGGAAEGVRVQLCVPQSGLLLGHHEDAAAARSYMADPRGKTCRSTRGQGQSELFLFCVDHEAFLAPSEGGRATTFPLRAERAVRTDEHPRAADSTIE